MNIVILALIAALQKEVVLLETELAQLQSVVATTTQINPILGQNPLPQKAPLGYEYNGFGQLVPIGSETSTVVNTTTPILGSNETTTATSTPQVPVRWECIDAQGFAVFTNHPDCSVVTTPYPPVRMIPLYQ